MRLLAFLLAAGGVVPWLPTQPARAPAHPPLAPACRASDLRASLFLQGATGSLVGGLDLTNRSARACSLVGRPRLTLAGAAFPWKPGTTPPGLAPSPDPLADPVGSLRALAPGKTAYVFIWWSNWCGRPPAALQLGLGAGTALRVPLTQAPRCDQPSLGSTFAFDRFLPRSVPLPGSSRLPLTVAITGSMPVRVKGGKVRAFSAHRGELLRYVVVVTNSGSEPFRFGAKCPRYVQDFDTQVAYVLNCRPAGTLAPGGSVGFAMQVRIATHHRLGYDALGWTLAPNTYDAPETTAPVRITR